MLLQPTSVCVSFMFALLSTPECIGSKISQNCGFTSQPPQLALLPLMATHFHDEYQTTMQKTQVYVPKACQSSAPTQINTQSPKTSPSSSHSHSDLDLASPIAEWCHAMHLSQRRSYWWCNRCFPKSQPLHVPEQKILRREDNRHQPSHGYQ